jgi:hypothetical protein
LQEGLLGKQGLSDKSSATRAPSKNPRFFGMGSKPTQHECTNLDGWCTDESIFFVASCPFANQGGYHRLTIGFLFLSPFDNFLLVFSDLFIHLFIYLLASLTTPVTYLPTYPICSMQCFITTTNMVIHFCLIPLSKGLYLFCPSLHCSFQLCQCCFLCLHEVMYQWFVVSGHFLNLLWVSIQFFKNSTKLNIKTKLLGTLTLG